MDEKRPLVNDDGVSVHPESPIVDAPVPQPTPLQSLPSPIAQPEVQPLVQQHIILQVALVRRGPQIIADYQSEKSRRSGIAQLVLGGLAIAINIAGFVLQVFTPYTYFLDDDFSSALYVRVNHMYYHGSGLWCPLFFVSFSGAFALAAACRKTKCMIIASMVFNILGSVASGVMLVYAVCAVTFDSVRVNRGFYFQVDDKEPVYCYPAARKVTTLLTLSILWVLTSFALLSLCIWTATLACQVTCKSGSTSTNEEPDVTTRYVVNPNGSAGSQLLVVDPQGRPISGAQVIQLPAPGTSQSIPQTSYPGNVQGMTSTAASLETKQAVDVGLPPPYE